MGEGTMGAERREKVIELIVVKEVWAVMDSVRRGAL
jgi:hypothetical protein